MAVADQARERIEALQQYTDEPLTNVRVTVRETNASRPYVVDASFVVKDRLLAAHTAGKTPEEALDKAVHRLRRQILRVTKSEVAQRNEPIHLDFDVTHRPEAERKPPSQRRIVHRHPYVGTPISTGEAVRELVDLDLEFFLFTHERTGEDVVVYRRDDGRIGLLHPQGSELADENDIVVAEPSRYSEPITLEKARAEMDWLNHRFLYFIDAEDGRGKVLYLRHDGDYGLVVPHA
jgi:ribosome-associated translation inhibitor RaiA